VPHIYTVRVQWVAYSPPRPALGPYPVGGVHTARLRPGTYPGGYTARHRSYPQFCRPYQRRLREIPTFLETRAGFLLFYFLRIRDYFGQEFLHREFR